MSASEVTTTTRPPTPCCSMCAGTTSGPGYAPNAFHLPLWHLVQRIFEVPRLDGELPVARLTGGRSGRASQWLTRQATASGNVGGKMLAWQQAGHPLEGNSAAPTVS